jgi:hypothetical protein
LAAGSEGGFVVTGSRLTAWRPQLLRERRSVHEHPGAIAIAPDGQACATAAPFIEGRRLRSYRLPGLELLQDVEGACNDSVDISPSGELVACVDRTPEASFVRLFTFPRLKLVRSWGPIVDSIQALSFVGTSDDRLAVATTLLDPPGTRDDARTRLDCTPRVPTGRSASFRARVATPIWPSLRTATSSCGPARREPKHGRSAPSSR